MKFSAANLNFGVLQMGLTSAPRTVTVTNVSSHSVTFTSIASSGNFSQNHTCPTKPATLNAGQNGAIQVAFAPTAAGTRNGAVTLTDNDPGSPTQTVALTGIGTTNAMTLLPRTLSFPGQIPGTSSSPVSITLYNDGTAAVNINTATISISPADGTFTQTNNCAETLNPNMSCVIEVVFTPPDSGNFKQHCR
jgi:hypothetical protein